MKWIYRTQILKSKCFSTCCFNFIDVVDTNQCIDNNIRMKSMYHNASSLNDNEDKVANSVHIAALILLEASASKRLLHPGLATKPEHRSSPISSDSRKGNSTLGRADENWKSEMTHYLSALPPTPPLGDFGGLHVETAKA